MHRTGIVVNVDGRAIQDKVDDDDQPREWMSQEMRHRRHEAPDDEVAADKVRSRHRDVIEHDDHQRDGDLRCHVGLESRLDRERLHREAVHQGSDGSRERVQCNVQRLVQLHGALARVHHLQLLDGQRTDGRHAGAHERDRQSDDPERRRHQHDRQEESRPAEQVECVGNVRDPQRHAYGQLSDQQHRRHGANVRHASNQVELRLAVVTDLLQVRRKESKSIEDAALRSEQ